MPQNSFMANERQMRDLIPDEVMMMNHDFTNDGTLDMRHLLGQLYQLSFMVDMSLIDEDEVNSREMIFKRMKQEVKTTCM